LVLFCWFQGVISRAGLAVEKNVGLQECLFACE
jgi:hypothetical protein